MMQKKKLLILTLAIPLFFVACKKKTTTTPVGTEDCTTVTFSGNISGLIESKCVSCHGSGSGNGQMTNYDQIKVYADNGKLKTRVLDTQDMPQEGSLTSQQLGQIKCWLDDGAPNN